MIHGDLRTFKHASLLNSNPHTKHVVHLPPPRAWTSPHTQRPTQRQHRVQARPGHCTYKQLKGDSTIRTDRRISTAIEAAAHSMILSSGLKGRRELSPNLSTTYIQARYSIQYMLVAHVYWNTHIRTYLEYLHSFSKIYVLTTLSLYTLQCLCICCNK